jgi:glycosyltransferase involved in cell wall biosynthesis
MNNVKASIIIPTRDKLSRLLLVLKVLEHQITSDVEVIIVFDGCKDETVHIFNKQQFSFNPTVMACKDNIGCAAARNRGLGLAKGEIIIFLDDDRIPHEDFIKNHIKGQIEPCVLLGQRHEIFLSEADIRRLTFLGPDEICRKIKEKSFIARESRGIYERKSPLRGFFRWLLFWTGNVSVPKKTLDEVGGFNENFFGSGLEDNELGYRISKKNIQFKQDFTIKNYHLQHDYYNSNRYKDIKRNLDLFMETCNGDKTAMLLLKLIHFEKWWLYRPKRRLFSKRP